MSQFHVEPAELRAYAQYMRTLAGQFGSVKDFAVSEGCNTSGFTGLLTILQPVVEGVGDIYGATLDLGRNRMNSSAYGLDATAATYENTDQSQAANQDAIEVPAAPQPVGGN